MCVIHRHEHNKSAFEDYRSLLLNSADKKRGLEALITRLEEGERLQELYILMNELILFKTFVHFYNRYLCNFFVMNGIVKLSKFHSLAVLYCLVFYCPFLKNDFIVFFFNCLNDCCA